MSNRVGKFEISRCCLEKGLAEKPMSMVDIFSVEYSKEREVYIFVASCHRFDEVEEGQKIPTYTIEVTESIEFKKC